MRNIFAKFQDYIKKPNRNVFDMSFRNNLTLKFGELVPVFCKEVMPGDSFQIDSKFGLQLMPMKFPIQTPIKGYLHYFYVRNRNTWKDWMDFMGGTKDNLVPPYVQPVDKKKFYRVGGLADYLGVPNTLYSGSNGSSLKFTSLAYGLDGNVINWDDNFQYILYGPGSPSVKRSYACHSEFFIPSVYTFKSATASDAQPSANDNITEATIDNEIRGKSSLDCTFKPSASTYYNAMVDFYEQAGSVNVPSPNYAIVPSIYFGDYPLISQNISVRIAANPIYTSFRTGGLSAVLPDMVADADFFLLCYDDSNVFRKSIKKRISLSLSTSSPDSVVGSVELTASDCEAASLLGCTRFKLSSMPPVTADMGSHNNALIHGRFFLWGDVFAESDAVSPSGVVNISDLTSTPYDSNILLSALPFRSYEAIYNAYYRNPQNNPFVINGQPEYNKFNTTYDGGADNTQYDLYFRNWEYDFLTSAVQSPQQGIAPLVGMSVTGEATFQDEEGNTFYAQAIMNENGEITGWQSHSSDMPVGSLRLLMDMAGTGISINDLRNVNAFQRFLENNIRHGLRYRDQIMSHFGVKARYDELDMPEFIGGCSADVDIYKVSQTSNSGDTPLGSFVGQGQAFGEQKHTIRHYCDEHGFIIGILSVVPVPVYSQLLPKYFIKRHQLDYYYPEFGHIGYQPILQKEVSPLQTFYAGGDLNKVFGYQRAWYDYLASTDEVHGQFRTTMRDFLMNRTFEDEPELGSQFLTVDPDQLNDVFLAGTDDDLYSPEADKIIGSVLFNVKAKRPIPLFGIPKLEA